MFFQAASLPLKKLTFLTLTMQVLIQREIQTMHRKNDSSKTDIDKPNDCSSCGANVRNVRKFTGRESGTMKTFAQLDDTPILRGVLFAPGRIKVWCELCGDWHFYGWPLSTPDDALEHRVAHCFDKSGPYSQTGYYIRLERAA